MFFFLITISWRLKQCLYFFKFNAMDLLLLPPSSYSCCVWVSKKLRAIASWLTRMRSGGPSMFGKIWWGQVLKEDAAYLWSSHSFMRSLLSGWHANGSDVGGPGGSLRVGQEHAPGRQGEPGVLVLSESPFRVWKVFEDTLLENAAPTRGKSVGMIPNWVIASCHR